MKLQVETQLGAGNGQAARHERGRRLRRSGLVPGRRAADVLALGLLIALIPRDAFAYLDAGSASVIFQSVLAAVLGLGVIAKVYWHRLRGFLGLASTSTEADGEADDGTP